ncbi:MAG: transposase [bacterium]
MGRNVSTPMKGTQDELPYHVKRIKKLDPQGFIDSYVARIAVIIEYSEIYQDYNDKIAKPICLAREFLENLFSGSDEKEIRDPSQFVTGLNIQSKQYVRRYLHQRIREVCQDLYLQAAEAKEGGSLKTIEAEKRFRNYEINILNIINRLSKQDFESCNHSKVARQVMDELVKQVKKNGVKDNNGVNIKDYPSYIHKIVVSRMNDERRRNKRLRSFPGQDFDHIESSNGREHIEKRVMLDELHEYLRNDFFPRLDPVEGFVFRTYYLEDEFNQSKIRDSIHNIFGMDISIATISRMLKRLVAMIAEDLFYTPFEIDNFYELTKASNEKPLDSDWLFLFLDANNINLQDKSGHQKRCTHFLGYGVSREVKKEILINKVFYEQETLDLWQQVFQELKNRGMTRLLMMITKDYPDFVSFSSDFFPKVDHQLSLYQLRNNAHKYLNRRDYALFKSALKEIFSCTSFEGAHDRLMLLCRKLNKTYQGFISHIEEKAENFLVFIKYPSEVWERIGIFNIDEILNKTFKAIGQNAKKKRYREKELMARTRIKIERTFKSNFEDYDTQFNMVLPHLYSMFNNRFQRLL